MQRIVLFAALFFTSSASMAGEGFFFADQPPQRHKAITQGERDNILAQGYACNRARTPEDLERCRREEDMAQQALMKRIQANHQMAEQQRAEMRSLYRQHAEGR